MHWRGRFGIQEKKFCHYFLVLKEGTGKEKNVKRRLKHMNELEEIQRHPRHIVNSLAWWWIKSDWILPHYICKWPQWHERSKSGKVWCFSPWKKKERGGRGKKKRKKKWSATLFIFPKKNKEGVVSFLPTMRKQYVFHWGAARLLSKILVLTWVKTRKRRGIVQDR